MRQRISIFSFLIVGVFFVTFSIASAQETTSKNKQVYKYTVTTLDSDGDTGYATASAMAPYDKPVVAYVQQATSENPEAQIRLTSCTDTKCTNGTTVPIGIGGDFVNNIDVVVDSNGNPRVIYADLDTKTVNVVICADVKCISREVREVGSFISTIHPYPRIALDKEGIPIIAYVATDIRIVKCLDAECVTMNEPVDYAPTSGYTLSHISAIQVADNGIPFVSYAARDSGYKTGEVGVVQCEDNNCINAQFVTMDADVESEHTAMVLTKNSFPVVIYADKKSKSIKIASCTYVDCSTINTDVVKKNVTARNVEAVTNGNGKLKISYANERETKNGMEEYSLKVIHCSVKQCTKNTTERIDKKNKNVGEYSSIILDEKGLPFISYFDAKNKDLKVAKATRKANSK